MVRQAGAPPPPPPPLPLDKVLKHRLAADMLHVVGVRPAFKPPSGGGTAGSGGGGGGASWEEPPVLMRSMTGREPSQLGGVPLREMGDVELECLVEAEEEWC